MPGLERAKRILVVTTVAFAGGAAWWAGARETGRVPAERTPAVEKRSPARVAVRETETPVAASRPVAAVDAPRATETPAPAAAPARASHAIPTTLRDAREVSPHGLASEVLKAAARAEDPAAIARLGELFRSDPELAGALRGMLEAWLRAEDPERRARGVLFLAALDGPNGTARWQAALAAEAAPESRALLLAHPPVAGDPAQDAPLADALITALAREPEESVRAAALAGLPAELGREAVGRLAWAVTREPSAALQRRMTNLLARQSALGTREVEVLLALGLEDSGDRATRRHALRGLLRAEQSSPGTLAPDMAQRVRTAAKQLDESEDT